MKVIVTRQFLNGRTLVHEGEQLTVPQMRGLELIRNKLVAPAPGQIGAGTMQQRLQAPRTRQAPPAPPVPARRVAQPAAPPATRRAAQPVGETTPTTTPPTGGPTGDEKSPSSSRPARRQRRRRSK